MKLVVDSNIIIASLLKEGITRSLLMEAPIELVSPEWMVSEIRRHQKTIARRAGLSTQEFELLLALVTDRVSVVASIDYESKIPEAKDLIGDQDLGDVPFLALALTHECGIWTYNQKHFEGSGVQLWATSDVAAWTRSASAA